MNYAQVTRFGLLVVCCLTLVGCSMIPPEERITPVQKQRAITLGVKLQTHSDGRAEVSSLYPFDMRTVMVNLKEVLERKGGRLDRGTKESIMPGKYVAWWEFIFIREGTTYRVLPSRLGQGTTHGVYFMVIVQETQAKTGKATLVTFTQDPLGMSFWECEFVLSLTEDLQKKLQTKSLLLDELDSSARPPN